MAYDKDVETLDHFKTGCTLMPLSIYDRLIT